MISLGGQAPHVRRTPMGRTCGEPNEIELTPIGVEFDACRYLGKSEGAEKEQGEESADDASNKCWEHSRAGYAINKTRQQ